MADGENYCDVVDSWEDIDDSAMFQKTLLETRKNSDTIPERTIIVKEDSVRSQYIPPEPSVKILKRPSREERLNNSSGEACLNGSCKPVKSLRQREVEYAEARLRILGRASSPENELIQRLDQLNAGPPTAPSTVYMLLRPPTDSSPFPPGVIRNPRGPDDSSGFTLKR